MMRYAIAAALLACFAGAELLRADEPATRPHARVLLLTGVEHPAHHWRETAPFLAKAIGQDTRLGVTVVEDPAFLASPELGGYDVLVLNYMNWQVPDPGEVARENLRHFVEGGKGLVLMHFACGAFQGWPQYKEVAGRVWEPKLRGHDPRGPFRVRIVDAEHPITRGMDSFDTDDELYTCLTGDRPVHVLAVATSKVDGKEHPMAFTNAYGKGRVFHCVLGHDVKALSFANVQQLYRRGTAWAAGLEPEEPKRAEGYLSPSTIVAGGGGGTLYVGCEGGRRIVCVDAKAGAVVRQIAMSEDVSGVAASPDGKRLYVTSGSPADRLSVVELPDGKVVKQVPAGWGLCSPVVSPSGNRVYVCSRFTDSVLVIDPETGKTVATIRVEREPVAAAVTPDGGRLVVANLLPTGPATAERVAACVSIIETRGHTVAAKVVLPNGSTSLRGVAVSPDGKLAAIAHILARYNLPTTQLEHGWMNTKALSLVDVAHGRLVNTVLLDEVSRGAANPWGVAWSADGKTLCVTHAGTHELSVIDVPGLLGKLEQAVKPGDVPNDLAFLSGLRKRVPLPGKGPRAVTVVGKSAYVAEYFTDTLDVVDLAGGGVSSVALGAPPAMTIERKGELFFHDASLCFQQWQSCSTCHPDARVDGLNWDLINDGLGNPKNTKNMLLAHRTPPAMSLGVRDTAETAVRAGIRYIQFAVRPEEDARAIDEYLKSLTPTPSPRLVQGKLSSAAERGRVLFQTNAVGCVHCHAPPLFTNLRRYDVGTRGPFDKPDDAFDTPTLIECWRTAPYLHDGSAASVRDVLTTHNPKDRHGKTAHLTPQQIDDLIEYVLSL